MDFLHKLLNRAGNIVHNDVVAPVERAIHPAVPLPPPNIPSNRPPLNVSVATPPTPTVLDINNHLRPSTLPVQYGDTTYRGLLHQGPSDFDLMQQGFNNLTTQQRQQALGLNDWQSRWKSLPPGPSPSMARGVEPGSTVGMGGGPLTPFINKLRKIF
jgi:hypothetical protein